MDEGRQRPSFFASCIEDRIESMQESNFSITGAVEVLTRTPEVLRSLLFGLSDEWIGFPTDSRDRWEPYDVVGHLIHGEHTDWIPRARIILSHGDDRTFVPFDRFAQFEKSKGKSVAMLINDFEQLRTSNLDTLSSWNLTEEQLSLEGIHPELGSVTLRQLLSTWVVHDLNHIKQIVTIMARRYEDEVGVWKQYLSILQ